MDGSFRYDVGVEAVAKVDGIDVIATRTISSVRERANAVTDHSRSLYMMVKKTWRNRFTALIRTANKYSHASPDMVDMACWARIQGSKWVNGVDGGSGS